MTQRLIMKDGILINNQFDTQKTSFSGVMVVEGDRIVYIGETLPAQYETEDAEVINGKGLCFIPGLINTHGHAAMSLLRGYGDDMALQPWLQQKIWPIEANLVAEDVYWGTALSVVEMLKGGTTTFVDMYVDMDEVAKLCAEAGIRAWLTTGAIGLCSEAEQQEKLMKAIQFARSWNGSADGRIHTMMGPHAPYTCSPDFITGFIQTARDLDILLHIHMSETITEVEQNIKQYGLRPVAHLEKIGFFLQPSFVAHAVHLTDEEIEILARYKVAISHNPGSNLKLASGIARVPDLLRAGVVVSLGTDGPASNNNLDMFEEIRLAALIHKGISGEPTVVPAWEAFRMGTLYGAQTLRRHDLGALHVGMKADFVAINIEQAHFFPYTDLLSHIVYSASAKDVKHVWVDGKQVVKNSQCITLDEEQICYQAQRCFDHLLTR